MVRPTSFFFIPKSMRVMPKWFKIWFENLQGKCAKCELDSFGSVLACKEFWTCNFLSWHVMSRMFSVHFGMKSFLKKHCLPVHFFWKSFLNDYSCFYIVVKRYSRSEPSVLYSMDLIMHFFFWILDYFHSIELGYFSCRPASSWP